MNELHKLRLKKALYLQNSYTLQKDSLSGEVINLEFSYIDLGRYPRSKLKAQIKPKLRYQKPIDKISRQIEKLRKGDKITLGVY